jgi:hypothetical protein
LLTEIVIERFKVLLIIGPVAAKLDDVRGIVTGKLCVNNLEVVRRTAIRFAHDGNIGIRSLEQFNNRQGSGGAVVIAPPSHANLGRTASINRECVRVRLCASRQSVCYKHQREQHHERDYASSFHPKFSYFCSSL